MHQGSNGHGLTNCTHSVVSAVNGETVPTGWSKKLRVHSFPTRMKGSSWSRGRAEGAIITKLSLELRSSNMCAILQPAMGRGTPKPEDRESQDEEAQGVSGLLRQ